MFARESTMVHQWPFHLQAISEDKRQFKLNSLIFISIHALIEFRLSATQFQTKSTYLPVFFNANRTLPDANRKRVLSKISLWLINYFFPSYFFLFLSSQIILNLVITSTCVIVFPFSELNVICVSQRFVQANKHYARQHEK